VNNLVRDPVGEIIHRDGDNFQLRWHKGHVYGFGKQYSNPNDPNETPAWTGMWEVTDFGSPQLAKNAYPGLSDRIDAVCK
jgi:hypothetical protein